MGLAKDALRLRRGYDVYLVGTMRPWDALIVTIRVH